MVISRNLVVAIALDYVDLTVPEEIPISDQLWRIVKGRGGKRGYRQKVRHLVEGLKARHYSNVYPWVNESGRGYASQWSFTLVSDVYTGGTVWEVESSAEENEVVERPVVKAKSVPSPKVSSVPKAASSSSRDLGALPKGGPVPKAAGPRQPVTPPKASPKQPVAVPKAASLPSRPKASVAPSQQLQPRRCILPDQVVLIAREDVPNQEVQLQQNSRFVRQADTRGFNGYFEFFNPSTNERPKAIIAFDWHQVLDRSRTETAWAVNRIPKENVALLRRIKDLVKDKVVLVIVSHIERSNRNEQSLLDNLNQTAEVFANDLITFGLITRERIGVTGKYQTLFEVSHRGRVPFLLIDDNAEIATEFSQKRHGPGSFIHLKLRRKPQAPEGIPAESFLEDTYNLVKEWCEEIAEIDR